MIKISRNIKATITGTSLTVADMREIIGDCKDTDIIRVEYDKAYPGEWGSDSITFTVEST